MNQIIQTSVRGIVSQKELYTKLLRLFLIVLLCGLVDTGIAQTYSFRTDIVPYRPLENPQLISHDFSVLDRPVALAPVLNNSFNVKIFGYDISLDSVTIGSPGYCVFKSADGNFNMPLDPLVASMQAYDDSSGIYHGIDVEYGIRHYVVEWKNVALSEYPNNFYNFQMRLQEGTGQVQFHYGPNNLSDRSSSGILTGIFLLTSDNQPVKFKLIVGPSENPSIDSSSFVSSLTTYPAEGTLYSFGDPLSGLESLETSHLNIKISPNPARRFVNIQTSEIQSNMRVNIFNAQGQLLLSDGCLQCDDMRLRTNLSPGIYTMIVTSENQAKAFNLVIDP